MLGVGSQNMELVTSIAFPSICFFIKRLVHFQMKISPSFTHPQAILGVYDFVLSDEHNQRNINKYPDASELYNGSERSSFFRR